jgi:hypothetical protein
MSVAQKCTRVGALAALTLWCILASVSGSVAHADDNADLCAALRDHAGQGRYRVLDSRVLSHVQARPWTIVSDGVAFLLAAPRGTTEAELHRDVARCAAADGHTIGVARHGAHYVVKLTSRDRGRARELAGRAR